MLLFHITCLHVDIGDGFFSSGHFVFHPDFPFFHINFQFIFPTWEKYFSFFTADEEKMQGKS